MKTSERLSVCMEKNRSEIDERLATMLLVCQSLPDSGGLGSYLHKTGHNIEKGEKLYNETLKKAEFLKSLLGGTLFQELTDCWIDI